jgi:deoxycytidine triphosphate deaminase
MANESLVGLLSGEEIKKEGLVVGAREAGYRASTYDLSIGEIIPGGRKPAGLQPGEQYLLPPGGTIRVVANESLRLPSNVTGHALPRNTLCTKGVLAINIGIVDPGFDGPISSTLINFGDTEFPVRPGETFLRVSFHRCLASPHAEKSQHWKREEYVKEARSQVREYLAPTFLNIEETATKAAEKAFGSFRESLFLWATLAAVILALITVFAPLGASLVDRGLSDRRGWEEKTSKEIEQRVSDKYADQLKALTEQLKQLQNDIRATRASPRASASPRDNR